MITINPADINRVNMKRLEETINLKSNVLRIKPCTIKKK